MQLLGGTGSPVAQCLSAIKANKAPVNLDDELVGTLISVFTVEDDVKNEDEINLDDMDSDDEPPVDLKFRGLLVIFGYFAQSHKTHRLICVRLLKNFHCAS